jgi:NADH-quinone oxidoreductase subunit M
MISHAISIGALFILAGMLEERLNTRDMNLMGGLWSSIPRIGGITMYFVLASLALPGMGNFIGEFLILLGTYQANISIATIGTGGFIVSLIYNTSLIQRIFHGPKYEDRNISDLVPSKMVIFIVMIILIVWIGLYPQPIINTAKTAITNLQSITAISQKDNKLLTNNNSEVRDANQ